MMAVRSNGSEAVFLDHLHDHFLQQQSLWEFKLSVNKKIIQQAASSNVSIIKAQLHNHTWYADNDETVN